MRRYLLLLFTLLIVFSSSPTSTVSADIAPPEEADGFTLQPGADSTLVQMVRERVEMDVRVLDTVDGLPEDCLTFYEGATVAEVDALFVMRNQGSQSESMQVRFPLKDLDEPYTGNGYLCLFQVLIDNEPTPVDVVDFPSSGDEFISVPWAVFDAVFPPGKDVNIRVRYLLQAQQVGKSLVKNGFYYILSTGAGWYGKIGLVEFIFRLPYPANPEGIYQRPAGGYFTNNELRYSFGSLEPTAQDNLRFCMIAPTTWHEVLAARAAVDARPKDASAWIDLGRIYTRLTYGYYEYEFRDYEPRARRAFLKAIELGQNAQAYLEYVDFLLRGHELIFYSKPMDDEAVNEVFEYLRTAYAIDPAALTEDGLHAQFFAMWCCEMSANPCPNDNFAPPETATPTRPPTQTHVPTSVRPTFTPSPQSTITPAAPSLSPSVTQTDVISTVAPRIPPTPGQTPNLLCGSLLIGFFPLIVLFLHTRNKPSGS